MRPKYLFYIGLIVFGFTGGVRAESGEAFWLSDQYKPTGKEVGGLPIEKISADWTSASVFTPALLSAGAKKYLTDPGTKDWTADVAYDLKGDFNGDGNPDRALVGVYADKSGAMGRFLVILTKKKGAWTVDYLHKDATSGPGYCYLVAESNRLHFGTCFECDGMVELIWKGNTYEFLAPPEDDASDEQ